jgi:phenylalanyl-tRNA synthetase alpha subunit
MSLPARTDTGSRSNRKMFSIDRVFRNEAVDMTHLAEFHQVEGVVADFNLRLEPQVLDAHLGEKDLHEACAKQTNSFRQ